LAETESWNRTMILNTAANLQLKDLIEML